MEAGFPLTRVYPRCMSLSLGMPLLHLAEKSRWARQSGEWVYELFITTLPAEGFLVEDALDLYHGRGAFEAALADLRCGRRSRSLVLVSGVGSGTLADCVPMGVEPASLAREKCCRERNYVSSNGHT